MPFFEASVSIVVVAEAVDGALVAGEVAGGGVDELAEDFVVEGGEGVDHALSDGACGCGWEELDWTLWGWAELFFDFGGACFSGFALCFLVKREAWSVLGFFDFLLVEFVPVVLVLSDLDDPVAEEGVVALVDVPALDFKEEAILGTLAEFGDGLEGGALFVVDGEFDSFGSDGFAFFVVLWLVGGGFGCGGHDFVQSSGMGWLG